MIVSDHVFVFFWVLLLLFLLFFPLLSLRSLASHAFSGHETVSPAWSTVVDRPLVVAIVFASSVASEMVAAVSKRQSSVRPSLPTRPESGSF